MVRSYAGLEKKVCPVPEETDRETAVLKLKAMGVECDSPTGEQGHYLNSWEEGTWNRIPVSGNSVRVESLRFDGEAF